jgi:hypothetical protein
LLGAAAGRHWRRSTSASEPILGVGEDTSANPKQEP